MDPRKEHREITAEHYPTAMLLVLLDCRESALKRLKKNHPNRVILEEKIAEIKGVLKERKVS